MSRETRAPAASGDHPVPADEPARDREPAVPTRPFSDRSGRRLGRRQFIARAGALGLAAPVAAGLLPASPPATFGVAGQRRDRAGTPTAREDRAAPATDVRRATQPLAPAGRPRDGGALVVASPLSPDSLHPWLTQNGAGLDLLAGVTDGLVRFDAEQRLQPALAVGFDVSDDGRTYSFALREGVTFHDGSPFTAADFVASWKMRLSPAFGAAGPLGWDKIAAVEAPEPLLLVVRTMEPSASFLATVGTTPILPAGAMADGPAAFRERFDRAPVGTGPFRVVDWVPGEGVRLERFDDYWGERARLDRIEVRPVPSIADQLAGLGEGTYHLVGGAGGLPVDQVDEALTVPGAVVVEHGTQNWQHLDLKQLGFLRETRVRQALDFATPRQRIVEEVLDGRGIVAVADQAPGSWAYDPTLEPRPYLPERAEELLDQAGLRPGPDGVRERDGDPLRIELWAVADDPVAARIVDLIAESWATIGVAPVPRFGDATDLWGPMGYQFSDAMTAALYTWPNGNDPDDSFYWHSSQIPLSPSGGGGNLPAFFHPYSFQEAIDALTAEAAATLDRDARRQLYGQIQALLAREVPAIFLYWERGYAVASAELGGFWPNAYTPLLWNVQDWYLTEPAEEEPSRPQRADATSSAREPNERP